MPYPYEHNLVQQPFSRCSAIHREKSVVSFIRLLASTEEINPQKILNQSWYCSKGGWLIHSIYNNQRSTILYNAHAFGTLIANITIRGIL